MLNGNAIIFIKRRTFKSVRPKALPHKSPILYFKKITGKPLKYLQKYVIILTIGEILSLATL